MNVYVLLHAGLEDDIYVRGVYAERATAEADVATHEDRDGYDVKHGRWCCGVDEWPVLTEPVGLGPIYGPREPRTMSPLMRAIVESMERSALQPSIYHAFHKRLDLPQ